MTDYHKMTVAEKERFARDKMREPPVRCPVCEVAVQPEDLISHADDRCAGKPEPHPRSRWVSAGGAVDLGVTKGELERLVEAGEVRTKVEDDDGIALYLLRDVAKFVVARSASPSCKGVSNEAPKGAPKKAPKWLTEPPASDPGLAMQPLDENMIARLQAVADRCGGVKPASRLLDLPISTLQRALSGEAVRRGTRILIEAQLARAEGATCPG